MLKFLDDDGRKLSMMLVCIGVMQYMPYGYLEY